MIGYNESFHYWVAALKVLDEETGEYPSEPVYGGIMARGTGFEGEPDIEMEDWEGHNGTKSILLASDRTQISAEPQWEQKAMFGEFFEDGWYMLLGAYDKEEITLDDESKAYKWKFYQDILHPAGLPPATIINGYGAVENDAILYDNSKVSELVYDISDDGVNMTYTFNSNAPLINQENPLRVVGPSLSKLGVQDINVYIADYGTGLDELDEQELKEYDYGCVINVKNTFNTNIEESVCLGSTFGEALNDEGNFEDEGELEIQWNPKSKFLIDKWYTNEADGKKASTNPYFAELLITGTNRKLGTLNDEDVYEYCKLYLPKVEITKAWSDLSGDETKTINVEYQLVNNDADSLVIIYILSKLEDLHWGIPRN